MSRLVLVIALVLGCGGRTGMEVDVPPDAPALPDAPTLDAPPPDAPLTCRRVVTLSMTPTARLQLAVWIEGEVDFATIGLTEATALRGIGNRPGALQMPSGFHWPVGRRENVLPGWAGARLAHGGAPFPRVVFTDRASEGFLSGSSSTAPGTRDAYFCLSFNLAASSRDGLDAISCASTYHGDKGRYLTDADVAAGYAEPGEEPRGVGAMRLLSITSAYPARRDLVPLAGDHADVGRFAEDALRAMPELDAVSMATPAGERPFEITWDVPASWPAGPATVSVEVNSEGDYGGGHDAARYPTPSLPDGAWDHYAQTYGYPYRGQPSVIFDVAVVIPTLEATAPATTSVLLPTRMGSVDASLSTTPIDGSMIDDSITAPGSGVDRLRVRVDRTRLSVTVGVVCE